MTAGRSRVGRRRLGLLLAAAVLVVPPLTGCALAGRLLTAAGAASSISDLIQAGTGPAAPQRASSASSGVHAVVSGTRGSGLRLNRAPGADRLAVLPEGTVVTVVCQAEGREVTGPYGPTAAWSFVRTQDRRTGFMSDAYLRFEGDPATVPPC